MKPKLFQKIPEDMKSGIPEQVLNQMKVNPNIALKKFLTRRLRNVQVAAQELVSIFSIRKA